MDVCTYLFFDGDCQEAIELYVSAFGAEVVHLSRFSEAPENLRPVDGGDLVFHATLRIGSTTLNLSDSHVRDHGGFALLVHLDEEGDVDRLFDVLEPGGKVVVAPGETSWAKRYAVVGDRFGVVWKLQWS